MVRARFMAHCGNCSNALNFIAESLDDVHNAVVNNKFPFRKCPACNADIMDSADVFLENVGYFEGKKPMNEVKGGQVGGSHYEALGPAEPWKNFHLWMTPSMLMGYAVGEAYVYLMRVKAGKPYGKGGVEDVRKAHQVLEKFLDVWDREGYSESNE